MSVMQSTCINYCNAAVASLGVTGCCMLNGWTTAKNDVDDWSIYECILSSATDVNTLDDPTEIST